jgi:hypothetical protein
MAERQGERTKAGICIDRAGNRVSDLITTQ